MGSVNIKATVSPLVPVGTPSPLRLASPQQIRSLNTGLPNNVASSLSKDLDDVNRVINQLHTNQQNSPGITQLLLTNAAGQVTAAFGPVVYQGVPYVNFLSEIHVGNPLKTQNPQQALFNANLDGSVSIGQNGWIDVHDPWDGNAAWIGTQYDSVVVTNAINNGAGEIRLTVPGHTMVSPNNLQTGARNLNLWNVPNGNGDWPVAVIDANTIDLNGSIWSGPYGFVDQDGDVDPVPDMPAGLPTYQATIQRWLEIATITKPATLIQIETTIPHNYENDDQVHFPLDEDVATVKGQWTLTVTGATTFTLNDSTAVVPADLLNVKTCLRYFAGMLAQTIAIGPSFSGYNLRAFPNGDLRIRNATISLTSGSNSIVIDAGGITLTSTNGTIFLDPTTPAMILSSLPAPSAKVTLDASNGSIILNAKPASLAKIVIDSSVPNIVLYNSAGTQTVLIDANTGTITASSVGSASGFTGTATVRNASNTGTSTLNFSSGICTSYTP